MSFIKNIEDFNCLHCGFEVKGDGYTNHCPKCLWSRHVDVDPGDRKAECGGLMKPAGYIDGKILHKCEKCGFERKNKVQKDDNQDMIIRISTHVC
ncbi:MAG: RNHCP domain-containing protein [Candidatus Pacebacteria bacterium]|nr:RNHCP domain-containing protein [Candidatus Paceibacterota bacterium]